MSNNDLLLKAVLEHPSMKELGGYEDNQIPRFNEALRSPNCIINVLAQILNSDKTARELYPIVLKYIKNNYAY